MSEAPKRIWADGNAEWDSGSWGRSKEFDNDVEYVRADRIEERDDIIRHDRERIEELVSMVNSKADRIEELDAKLAKAVEALEYYAAPPPPPDVDDSLLARATLAELKEEDRG